MTRVPSPARRQRRDDDDDDESDALPPTLSVIESLGYVPSLGRPPTTDEEKEVVFSQLIQLKAVRKTNKDCAEILGVSERTIVNYLKDPLYQELFDRQIVEAQQGTDILVSELMFMSLQTLQDSMDPRKTTSEFVRYSAAKTVGEWFGLDVPRDHDRRQSAPEIIASFLSEVARRNQRIRPVQVDEEEQVVEADPEPAPFPMILPGGKLPTSWRTDQDDEKEEGETLDTR